LIPIPVLIVISTALLLVRNNRLLHDEVRANA